MYDGFNSTDSNALDLELTRKDKAKLKHKLPSVNSQIVELSVTLAMAKKEKEEAEQKHTEAIHAT